MKKNVDKLVSSIKKETEGVSDIIFRKKIIGKTKIYIIYNEPLTSSDKISSFVIKSLNKIARYKNKNLLETIENNITNFKVQRINTNDDLYFYLHFGYTIILIDGESEALCLETKADISRSISIPESENTYRGAKDAFVEEYQKNIGLIKKRIKSNKLNIKTFNKGKYTNTLIGVLSIKGLVSNDKLESVLNKIQNINENGIINSGIIKNLIEKENKSVFPTINTTERPDMVCYALLRGKIVIIIDNSPYALIIPSTLNEFFKTSEDSYGKSLNVSFTRFLKVISFFITLMTPGIYIALITYNQEILPTDLLVNFATQRDGVPFPAFVEALIMIMCFEILREGDLRIPSFSGSALSIVGALILGDAAVAAGIVSPVMIIIIAITAISALLFTEPEIIIGVRWWRLLFMIGASLMGLIGVVVIFIALIIHFTSLTSFGTPYLSPFSPYDPKDIKDSLFKASHKRRKK